MDPSTFVSYYSTLGNVFQPDDSQITAAKAQILAYVTNSTITGSSSLDTIVFSKLSDLSLYFPFSTLASSLTTVII